MKLSPLPLLLLQSSLSQVNYSRATTTQLVTQLNLRLDDLPRAPAVVDALRDALGALPAAIVDKRRRFWVHLGDVTSLSARIDVEVHYDGGDAEAFCEWRELAMLAIARVLDELGVRYALPSNVTVNRDAAENPRANGAGEPGRVAAATSAALAATAMRCPALCEEKGRDVAAPSL